MQVITLKNQLEISSQQLSFFGQIDSAIFRYDNLPNAIRFLYDVKIQEIP